MDGNPFLLFLLATFLGGFVSGFSGFHGSGRVRHLAAVITPIQTADLIPDTGCSRKATASRSFVMS